VTPEGRVKALVKRRMKAEFPTSYYFMPVQNGMGAPSVDFLYCINGVFVAIETKAPGGGATPRQETTMAEISRAQGLVFLVDGPISLEEAIEDIKLYRW
jgi:hypothetical protein